MSFLNEFEHSQALFDAAVSEFASKGYSKASINSILERAGMSKGQFYYHFKNKEALYLALIEIMLLRKKEFLAEIHQSTQFGNNIFSIFEARMTYDLAFGREYPAMIQLEKSLEGESGSLIYQKVVERFNYGDDDLLLQLIDLAYQKGDFRQDIPLPFIQNLLTYFFAHASEMVDLNTAQTFKENISNLLDVMKSGMGNKEERNE